MKRQRGAALVLVLMVTVVFLILIGSLIDILAIEWRDADTSARSNSALTAAYAGVDAMILDIEEFYVHSVQTGNVPTQVQATFPDPGGGQSTTSYVAWIPQQWHGNGLNYYLINSDGSNGASPNTVTRGVSALVREIPFTTYAMWTNSETSNTGNGVYYTDGQHYGGLVYSGGPMHVRYSSDPAPDFPIFGDGFQIAQGSWVQWYDTTNGDTKPPSTPAELAAVFGSGGETHVPHQDLPGLSQNLVVFSESFYGDAVHNGSSDLAKAASQPPGIYVNGVPPTGGNLSTGIFVNGDAEVKATGSSPDGQLNDGTQIFDIKSPTGAFPETTVTIDFSTNTTTISGSNSTATYTGVPSGASATGNGAIFVNGDLQVDGGSTIHGQYDMAVPDPPTNNEKITLTGSVKYASDPYGNPNNANSQDELALWANNIGLDDTTSGNIEIDGLIMTGYFQECTHRSCGGTFYNVYCDPSGCSGSGMGNMALFGSLVQNIRGKFGEVDSNLHLVSGFLRNDVYDQRLGAVPPPFSPTTNLYSIVALTDDGTGVPIGQPGP
jgi:hypothetical protein